LPLPGPPGKNYRNAPERRCNAGKEIASCRNFQTPQQEDTSSNGSSHNLKSERISNPSKSKKEKASPSSATSTKEVCCSVQMPVHFTWTVKRWQASLYKLLFRKASSI